MTFDLGSDLKWDFWGLSDYLRYASGKTMQRIKLSFERGSGTQKNFLRKGQHKETSGSGLKEGHELNKPTGRFCMQSPGENGKCKDLNR